MALCFKDQLNSYLEQIQDNPYLDELIDYVNKKTQELEIKLRNIKNNKHREYEKDKEKEIDGITDNKNEENIDNYNRIIETIDEENLEKIERSKIIKSKPLNFRPEKLSISTMTCLAKMNSDIDAKIIYDFYKPPLSSITVDIKKLEKKPKNINENALTEIIGFCLDGEEHKGFQMNKTTRKNKKTNVHLLNMTETLTINQLPIQKNSNNNNDKNKDKNKINNKKEKYKNEGENEGEKEGENEGEYEENLEDDIEEIHISDVNIADINISNIEFKNQETKKTIKNINIRPRRSAKKGDGSTPFNFYNSATLYVLYKQVKLVNVKLFCNGTLQMTGVGNEKIAGDIAEYIYDWIKNIPESFKNKDHHLNNLETVLINTNYSLGFSISRERLNYILINKYELNSQFETEGYPGIKLKYFWNKNTVHTDNEGICKCPNKRCTGKDNGDEIGHCKKITLAIFTSGNIIVTGGRSMGQIEDAYSFLNHIISDNLDIII